MKNLKSITLEHNYFKEAYMRTVGIPETRRSEFYLPLKDCIGTVSALNFKEASWEHVLRLRWKKTCYIWWKFLVYMGRGL